MCSEAVLEAKSVSSNSWFGKSQYVRERLGVLTPGVTPMLVIFTRLEVKGV